MNNITIDTIRTYVNKLEQKGYSSEEITRKLHTTLELMSWAYQNDHLKYSQFQQVKDEIANFKARFEASDLQEAQLAFKDSENLKSTKTPSFFDKITQRIPFYGSKKSENEENKKSTPQTNAGFQLNPQHYVGLAFVLLIMAILGAGIYERFFKSTGGIFAYPSTPSAASRILSFQGRLTDSLGNPITAATNMRFRLYTASSGGTTLYDTGTCSITPDQDGVHNVLIGSSCGSEVSSSVFTENTQVWLGVLVGSDAEMTPRQRMANVPYAMNAETLQGLPVGTEVSNIPYINAGGDLLMAAASPQIGSTYTNQDFLISSARALTIQSAGAGDVTLTATESGTIKFATGGSQHGVITNTGLFGFGSTGPDAKLDVLYTGGEQLRLTYADGSTYSSFTTNSGGDLTIDPSGDDLTIGGDLILADTFTVQVGGKTATAYNAFANSGDAPEDGSISSDNDVYIGGDLEVDGNIVGTVSPGFTQGSVVFTDGSGNLAQDNASFFFDDTNNLLGIGTASPVGKLHVTGAATGKALSIFNETGDQNIITASASGTTVANLDRSGNLAIEGAISDLGGTTLAVNDNLDVSGTLFSGTADAFQVDASGNITAVGGTFSGDIAVNGGDLTSSASTFNLSIANAGTINFRDGSNTLVAIKDQGVYPFLNLAGKTDTGDPGTCAEGDIYYNDTDDSIKVCHESNSWEALDGGAVASQWTDGGTTVYLTDTTDELVIGGSSPLSSAKVSIDGDADQIQLIVQGNATQTTNLATFEQSDGTDVFTITNAGNLTSAGDLAVNGDDITSDSNLTLNATGYTRIGDTASPGSANGDDDLFVEGDLEIDGVLYTDGGIDTAFTAGSVVFAGASGVLAQDNASFFWDDTNNKLGLGDTTPDAKLEISGAATGKALTILNETGDQDIIAASASGTTRFRVGNDGTVYGGYFADISNSAYGIDPAGTSNFGGYSLKVTGGALLAVDTGNVGIGDSTPDAKLNILATTEQLRLDYDDSNYASFTVNSGGDLTIAPTGSDIAFTGNGDFSGGLNAGSADHVNIDSSGNIGVGTTASGTYGLRMQKSINPGTTPGYYADHKAISYSGTVGSFQYGYGSLISVTEGTTYTGGNGTNHYLNQQSFANNSTTWAGYSSIGSWAYMTNNVAANTAYLTGTRNDMVNASTATGQDYTGFVANGSNASSGTIATMRGFSSNITNSSTGTFTNSYQFWANSPTNASGTITTIYGLRVDDQSVGTNTNAYGVYIGNQSGGSGTVAGLYVADADDYSIQLASTDGDAASGITFGTDTNLYRSAADTLKTDDAFFAVGNITTSGDLAVNGDDITADGALTINSASYTRIGDTASPGSATGDDDLYVEGDLEIDGILYTDGSIDTAFTAGSVVFAGTSGVLAEDNTNFFFNDSTNRLGIGDATPDAFLDLTGTTEQLRLSYETGDTNYASFTLSSGGDLTIAPTGGDLALTGDVDISDQFAAGPNGAITANTIGHIAYSTVPVDTNGTYGIQLTQTTTGSGSSSQGHTGIYNYLADNSTSTGNLTMTATQSDLYMQNGSVGGNSTWRNIYGFLKNESSGGTHNGSLYNFYASALNAGTKVWSSETNYYSLLTNSGAVTTSTLYNYYAAAPVNASGTITTAYGMRIEDQSVGTNTTAYGLYIAAQAGASGDAVGLYIADADDYSIQLASTDGDAASGITFGTDTNVYRSAANTLKTDDNLIVGLDLRIADTGTLEIGGLTGVAYNAISDSGTTSHSLASDDDLFVEGDLEVDGVLYADGGITATGTVSATDFSCTDCLDFAEFEDTLDLDTTLILNQGTNTWTQNFTGTTTVGYTFAADSVTSGTGIELSADALAGGKGLYVSSTSTALTTGNLALVDWSPGSTTNATGDLFKINIGTNGNVGNILNVTDTSSSLFRVAENQIESAIPHSFTAAGDVSIAYDLLFSNQTASFIKSSGPFTIEAGETFESNDFTLKTYNSGNVLLDAGGSTTNTGTISFYDSNIKGATVTTAIPFANASADINTFRTNFTDETIIDALNEVYAAASAGGVWTDSATTAYLTTTTDDVVIGGSSPLSSAKLSIDGDADQTQLIVQGNATQTTDLVIFETSAGADLFNLTNAGNLDVAGTLTSGTANAFVVDASGNVTTAGDLAVNGNDITSGGNLTLNATGYVRVGDTATPGSASGDDDLYVESDLEVDGVVYLDGTLDTTFTAGSVVFAGTNGVLTQDNSSFFFDDTNNRLGIGDTTPDAFLDITGTTAQLRLSYETTDTNYTTFTTSSGGDLTIAPSGSDTAITGNVDISGTLKAGTSDAFQVDASGNVIANDMSMGGEFSGVDGYGDSGSMIANGSLELDLNTGGLPDGWAHDTGSHDGTRSSSSSYNGDYHYRIDAETAENGFQTSCFPVSDAQTYYIDLYAKAASGTTSHMDLNYIEYSTRADCEADSAAGIGVVSGGLTTTSSWAEFGGSYSPEPDIRWLKFEIENNDTSGATNQDLYIDAVRVWYNTTNGGGGLDLAETYPINKNEHAQVAEIVSFGSSEKQNGADVQNIKKSSSSYDNNAFGVTATQPGLVLDDNGTYNKIKVALKGRVPVLVTTENGPIKVGDPITASSKPGIGMKATRSGRIVGYAMSEWTSSDPNEIDHVILFVNPETYVDLSILTQLQESVAKFPSMTASVLTQADSIIIDTAEAALLKTESLIATTIKATNATIDNLIVDRIVSREITSVSVKTETLQAQNIEAKDATFSGKLVAQEIDADNIRELRDRLERLSVEQNSEPAFDSAGLQAEVESIQDYLENLPEQETSPSLPINEIATNTSIDPGTITSITGEQISMMDLENLTVTGTAAMTSLAVADSFTAGNIFVKDNSVLSLSNELKLSALEQVNIMDGAVIIAKNGTITAKGEVIAEKGVRTNTIKPLDANSAVGLQLSQNKVEVLNNNNVVAAINNDGSAKFKDVSVDTYTEATGSAVIIAAEDNYDENGILSPGIQTNAAAAGNGIIPAKNDTIVIFNDTISAKSLVYVTASSKTYNQNLYVAEKKSCTAEEKLEENCKPYFTVHIDGVVKDAITFNWWIVN